MDPRFAIHNAHREGEAAFLRVDPHLRRLAQQPLVWQPPLLDRLPVREPGVYTLGGARQVGKSTLLKQWMVHLVRSGVDPRRIAFLTGELVDDHHALHRILAEEIEEMPSRGRLYLVVDEVSYVAGWDRAVKFLADSGGLERAILVLTGSDLGLIRDVRTFLPGRRGKADEVDFHLHPLTWLESCELKKTLSAEALGALGSEDPFDPRAFGEDAWVRCWRSLEEYLCHGGFLTAMNDVAAGKTIRSATLATYSDWIRGDMLKRGKNEEYVREVLGAIVRRLGAHVSWNALARDLSIDHPLTVADYTGLLERMDAVFVQKALREDRLAGAPKKARKIVPTDPFIFHAVRCWLDPSPNPFQERIRSFVEDVEAAAALVESVVAAHARRSFPTFYIKAEGEVDVALVSGKLFWPIEVKWQSRMRAAELKQVSKYARGRIAARVQDLHTVAGVPVIPLPRVLALLGLGRWPPRETPA